MPDKVIIQQFAPKQAKANCTGIEVLGTTDCIAEGYHKIFLANLFLCDWMQGHGYANGLKQIAIDEAHIRTRYGHLVQNYLVKVKIATVRNRGARVEKIDKAF